MKNETHIRGILASDFFPSTVDMCRVYYKNQVLVMRDDGRGDYIPILVPNDVLEISKFRYAKYVDVLGQCRTYRDSCGFVHMHVLVRDIRPIEMDFLNQVQLEGYICHTPKRRTSTWGTVVTDTTVGVNRDNSTEADFIPCVINGSLSSSHSHNNYQLGKRVILSGAFRTREQKRPDSLGSGLTDQLISEVIVDQIYVMDGVAAAY